MNYLRSLHVNPQCTKGQDLIEYALMASIVALAVAVVIPDLTVSISQVFSNVIGVLEPQTMSALTVH
jgi:Flp pilus assembly pilin Flp